jgi:hypothetical protein
MLYFATIFDINYLSRGLAFYDSMYKHHRDFVLYIVCLDDKVYSFFLENKFEKVTPVQLAEIENFYPELLVVKAERSKIDYIFTLSPYYPSFILSHNPEIPFICSLDVDQYFFGSCEPVFKELEKHSVLIMPHRFPDKLKHLEKYGIYNVSFQVFKNDPWGRDCLQLWQRQCYHWCKDELEEDKYADQKYLETWDCHFRDNVKAIDNPGLGLAPWNLATYKIAVRNDTVFVGNNKLILFHYQGLRFLNKNLINTGISKYGVKASKIVVRYILQPIVNHLSRTNTKKITDTISRVTVLKENGFLKRINSEGMYCLLGNKMTSLDSVYLFNVKKQRLNGLFNRLKNLYR